MSEMITSRVNPRALLSASQKSPSSKSSTGRSAPSRLARFVCITMATLIGLSSFGVVVVKANDDAGVLAFVRQQSRPAFAAPRRVDVMPAAPLVRGYDAMPASFRTSLGTGRDYGRAEPRRQNRQQMGGERLRAPIAAFAPFGNFFPSETLLPEQIAPRRRAAGLPAPARQKTRSADVATGAWTGSAVTYCVRTCDGFFFPLSTANGDRSDEQACARMCPAADTKVYSGRIGDDMGDARARENGRRYSALPAAFRHRQQVSSDCSCQADGIGIANTLPIARDASLRVGDIVMTKSGMRVFTGGSYPYREANFSRIERVGTLNAKARENLRAMERASLPGRSGIAAAPRPRTVTEELSHLIAPVERPAQGPKVVRFQDTATVVAR